MTYNKDNTTVSVDRVSRAMAALRFTGERTTNAWLARLCKAKFTEAASAQKLDELGVYLRRVDKLVASVEALAGWTISVKPGEPWDTQSVSMLQGVRDALEEVQS